MPTTTGAMDRTCRSSSTSLAVIVHPKFKHTLSKPPQQSQSRTAWTALPQDALHKIAQHLAISPEDLCHYELVNKGCRTAANDDRIWRKLVLEKFGWQPPFDPPSWRELYRFNHEFLYKVILKTSTDRLMHVRMGGLNGLPFNIPIFS